MLRGLFIEKLRIDKTDKWGRRYIQLKLLPNAPNEQWWQLNLTSASLIFLNYFCQLFEDWNFVRNFWGSMDPVTVEYFYTQSEKRFVMEKVVTPGHRWSIHHYPPWHNRRFFFSEDREQTNKNSSTYSRRSWKIQWSVTANLWWNGHLAVILMNGCISLVKLSIIKIHDVRRFWRYIARKCDAPSVKAPRSRSWPNAWAPRI